MKISVSFFAILASLVYSFAPVQTLCPGYTCSSDQAFTIDAVFRPLDLAVASRGGGCDVCLAAVKHVWCATMCQTEVPWKEIAEESSADLLVKVTPELAEGIYEACGSVKFFKGHQSDGLAILNHVGTIAATFTQAPVYFQVSEGPAFDLSVPSCAYRESSLFGYAVSPCSCQK